MLVGDVVDYVPLLKSSPLQELGAARWHIVMTDPRCEPGTAERLAEELEVETYVPLEHRRVRAGRGRRRDVQVAMFPCYFFAHLPGHEEAWRRARRVRGVAQFLSFADGRPKCLAAEAVLAIRWLEGVVNGRWLQRQVQQHQSPFAVGEQVWAEILPYTTLLGTVSGFDPRGRVKVLLEIEVMGRKEWPLEPRLLREAS